MKDTVIIIITALLSGIVGSLITIWWQNKTQYKNEKVKIFKVLMSKRYEISAEESVEALNMIDIVFYSSEKVRNALKEFKSAADVQNTQLLADKHLKLLEEIAEDIGYKNIKWDDIKNYYYPNGLADKKQEEAALRKAQLEAAVAQLKSANNGVNGTVQVNKGDELASQMFIEAMKNPDGLLKLVEATEKINKTGKRK